jgi:Uma2 family endonuclease
MSTPRTTAFTADDYERAAQEYRASLTLEDFMEGTPQATQREICVQSFALLQGLVKGFHYFNELLIQFFHEGNFRRVCPDNMVVLGDLPERDRGHFDPELEPCPAFWVLEYVSPNDKRKDYEDSFRKYEELKVPCYLVFDPATRALSFFRLDGEHYARQAPDAEGRFTIPELDLRFGVLDGWVRFWHRGELLELPRELRDHLDGLRRQLREAEEQARREREEKERAEEQLRREREEKERAEERLRAERQALVAGLRPLVEERARQANRQDILERLPSVTDGPQLLAWLAELR